MKNTMKTLLRATIACAIIVLILSISTYAQKNEESDIMLGMVLLEKAESMETEKVLAALEKKWKLTPENVETRDAVTAFSIDGYMIALMELPIQIPRQEIASTAQYNYHWDNGFKEAMKHKSHIVVTILGTGKEPVFENVIMSTVISSILDHSVSIGVYLGDRTLLLEKEFYQENVQLLNTGSLPLDLWVYFGGRKEKKNKTSVYTYGLEAFGKKEIEILSSKESFEDLQEMLYNITHYVLESDVKLKHGETIGESETQKLKISITKGKYLAGRTIKIDF